MPVVFTELCPYITFIYQQFSGVHGAIRSPLHAILSLLRPLDSKSPSPSLLTCPQLAESAYRLVYTLALNNQTSEPILRFLRYSKDNLGTI